ncbi:xanthine dehydrogenase family protein molybdopterin-binding subunit [Ancylobacter mangrovi]|uniref:xanthine dehydrogenase family protein molybdopterin-binding subunit n=1 Tax=Ancylobacter mangrovi TaxID=2972472 RepID=UPI0021632115|nr:xanthine dehydrogenase family protein molybdopterin-binding subunit [Ancylobacter mangrovi]MCS0503730.1 xanthine dehydrogenase family protein molybdopterin-binding subunit [Ancylobacter mangrovi]
MARSPVIGASVPRIEDRPLVRGRGRFVGDINFPRQLHMRIVRSPIAHGRLLGVDTAAARAMPGVVAIWTGADLEGVSPIDFREGPNEKLAPFRQPILARDTVRYVGEPVAAVFAEDAYLAEDAAETVTLDIEELPPILAADEAPGGFSPGHSTEATLCTQDYGDIADAFARAHAVVELDLKVGRHSGVPMETRGAVGRYDAARDALELHGAAKVPHKNREFIARMLGRPQVGIHCFEPHVGGGFGIRGELYPEDMLVLLAALRLDRPVKWIEDRREHLMAANHSRQQRHRIRAAVDAEGHLLGIENEFFHDQGAYVRTHGTRVADSTCGLLPGPYRLPAYRALGHFRLTNKTPAATYRSPARYETNFVRERLMDAIAVRLGLPPLEVRRRNLISSDEMPFARPLAALGEHVVYDSGDYAGLLDKSLTAFGWEEHCAGLAARRARGEKVGAAVAMFVEKSGLGPTDGVRVVVDVSGSVEVITGGASVGQGFETIIAQICAEELGVDYAQIRVTHGRTDRIEFGVGAHASRASVMTGNATAIAAAKVRAKAIDMAAELMQAPPDRLDIVAGRVVRTDQPDGPSIDLATVAKALVPAAKTRGGREPGLSADGWFDTAHQTYPYGLQIASVKVDEETGAIAIERLLIAYDIGRAINPMLVRGQIVGGFAQGLGGAIYEEFSYDERGEPLSVTFADYLIPTAAETPAIEVLLTEDAPSPCNPLGIKGAGEAGISAVGAVIASAVDQALGMDGLVVQLPLTPQRLKAAIERHRAITV